MPIWSPNIAQIFVNTYTLTNVCIINENQEYNILFFASNIFWYLSDLNLLSPGKFSQTFNILIDKGEPIIWYVILAGWGWELKANIRARRLIKIPLIPQCQVPKWNVFFDWTQHFSLSSFLQLMYPFGRRTISSRLVSSLFSCFTVGFFFNL